MNDYLAEKRRALDAWARLLRQIVDGSEAPTNVVRMALRRLPRCPTRHILPAGQAANGAAAIRPSFVAASLHPGTPREMSQASTQVGHRRAKIVRASVDNQTAFINVKEFRRQRVGRARRAGAASGAGGAEVPRRVGGVHRRRAALPVLDRPVDVSRFRCEGLSSRQADAANELSRARLLLGERAYALVVRVCAEGYGLRELAATRRERDTLADVLRLSLSDLASRWGFSGRGANRGASDDREGAGPCSHARASQGRPRAPLTSRRGHPHPRRGAGARGCGTARPRPPTGA